MRGSSDLSGSCIAADTACGQKTALPSGNPCAEYPLSLSMHQSVRLHQTTHQLFFRTGTRAEAGHLDKVFCTRLRSRMGGIVRSLFTYHRASAYSSNFWNAITLELRASLLAGDPHGHTGSVVRFRFSLCFCFCLVLYQVEISTILQFPNQQKPLQTVSYRVT